MSYTEYLRRKAAAAPKIVDTTVRLDASSYTQRVKFAATQINDTGNFPTIITASQATVVRTFFNSAPLPYFAGDCSTPAFDNSGNLYIGSTGDNAIFKITPGGTKTLLAGGTLGTADGTGAAAQFNFPSTLCIDSTSTNLYVSDTSNFTIRQIVISTGVVTTLAGSAGVSGSTDATGIAASFANPAGICIDSTNSNLYVCDSFNGRIRRITLPGAVVTRFDDAVTTINSPGGITIDKTTGTLYVTSNNRIIKITSGGVTSVIAGLINTPAFADGTGTAARFSSPAGICIDATNSNLYVADFNNQRIRNVTLPGVVVTTISGTGASGVINASDGSSTFNGPSGIAFRNSTTLTVTESSNRDIRDVVLPYTYSSTLMPINKSKAGGRIQDASLFTQYIGGQAVGKEVQAPKAPARVTLNSNTAGSISGCAVVQEPVAYVPGGTLIERVTATFSSITGTQPNMTYNINGYTVRSGIPYVALVPGSSVTISGTGNQAGNNGTFVIVSSTSTSFTVSNASGIADATPLTTQIVTLPVYSSGAFSANMVPLTGSQPGRNAVACRQLQGEPHRQNELGPSLFVDNTIVGIKNYNLPQNSGRSYVASKCTQCGTNGTEIGKTCAFCIGATHLHPVDMPHNTRWGPRPRKSAQPIIVNASPSNARKVGNFAPRHIPYVEKHHGNAQLGHIIYPKTPYRIPDGTPAQLKINNPKNIPMV